MEQLGYDHEIHQRTNAGDDSLFVRFFTDLVEDQEKTKEEGRPIYKDAEWIDIRIPGDKDNVVIRPVREADKQRFPQHYAAFKQRTEKEGAALVGTPLNVWPGVTPSQAKEFEYFNIFTVENLASAPDNLGQKFMGFNALKKKAADYIEAAKEAAPILDLQERNNYLEQALKQTMDEVAELKKQIEGQQKSKKA